MSSNDDAPRQTEPGDGNRTPESKEPGAGVDSRWWYWVAAVPVYYVLASAVGFVVGLAAFALAVTGVAGAGSNPAAAPVGVGLGFAVAVVGVLVLVAVGMLLSVVFPLAIYLDASAVRDARGDWQPDPALYGLVGLVGIVAQPIQIPLAVYYLFKRHESVGRP